MRCGLLIAVLAVSGTVALSGCGTPQAKLTYAALPSGGLEGSGFPFVVPRTVLKVAPAADKAGATESVAFTPVPMASTADSKQLPTFYALDSSSGGVLALTPTTVSSVSYLDELIINAIGTQVTDNRKDAIDVVVTAASLAGAFASAQKEPDCATDVVPLKPFVIEVASGKPPQAAVPNSPCWAYSVKPAGDALVGRKAFPVDQLASVGTVDWFPIPVCKAYKIRVFHCNAKDCSGERKDVRDYATTVSLSDGSMYQRIPLPAKGKVSLHTDFCGADTTNESVGTSDWGLLKQVLTDIKSEKSKK